MDPLLPENAIGNLLWFLPVVIEESETDLAIIVLKMKKLVNEFIYEKAMKFKDNVLSVIGEFSKWRDFKEMEIYSCSGARVTLEEENMFIFERDEELLDSASFNPSALVSDMIQ
ncbi:hypothetical protein PanWU01x14_122070 [Parasponia andersonii]|uniref:Uncharacterized protein n=1 Tax=Parasponia andersonii TaxID=3476 RepID=A0A2P5CUJ7_PARAD|nr:hypothetical protein PanWU01x14_122070 [Parasponia andersonii]